MKRHDRSCSWFTPALFVGLSLLSQRACGAEGARMASALNTVRTMRRLAETAGAPGQVVLLLGYHRIGDGGGGLFRWAPDSVADDNGGAVIAVAGVATGRWTRVADDVKVTYFGARGDGVADDTAAIQAAIDSVSSTAPPGVVFDAQRKVGGTVHFPRGKYRISDTLLVGPSTTLRGVGSASGFQRRSMVDRDKGSVIIARFEDPRKWMISTAVYRRGGESDRQLIPYRAHISGGAYDRGAISRANGVKIRDLLLIGETNADGEPPYGGIRLQACPGAVLHGVGVFGVDVAYMLNAGWGLAVRDCSSGSYLYGLLALYDVNGLHIDNCYINGSRSDRVIDDTTMAPGPAPKHRGRAANMPEDYAYKKVGILTHYGHSVTLNNVITEHWDIARYHIHGSISDTGSWLEGNRELGYPLVTVQFDLRTPRIHAPRMIAEGRFLRAGTNVRATISQSPAFPITYGTYRDQTTNTLQTANMISITVPDPDRNGWKHYPLAVSYVHRIDGRVRVAGDDDEAVDNTRIADTTSYVDLSTALQRIGASDRRDWTITVKDGAVCTLSRDFELQNKVLRFVQEGIGDRPVIRITPDADGNAGRLHAVGGGRYEFDRVDIAVYNPRGVLDPHRRGLIAVEGGAFELAMSTCSVSLVDTEHASAQEFSLLQSPRAPAVVDAVFSDVTIKNGHSLLVDGTKHGSVVSCRAVQTTAPRELLDRGTNGWLGENTVVLHSTIQAVGD